MEYVLLELAPTMTNAIRRSTLVASLALLVAPKVGAAPAPSGSSSPTTSSPTTPIAIATPTFAGLPIGSHTATMLRAAAGETRPAMGWNHCASVKPDGSSVVIDHCVAVTVGTAFGMYSYLVTDTPCPSGAISTVCYGGYLLEGVAHGEVSRSTAAGISRVVTTAELRLVEHHLIPGIVGGPPPRYVDILPTAPHLSLEQTTSIDAAGVHVGQMNVFDQTGTLITNFEAPNPLLPSTMSCSDFGDLVGGTVTVVLDFGAVMVAGGGIALSFGSGLGAPAGSAIALGVGAMLMTLADKEGAVAGDVGRELCEMLDEPPIVLEDPNQDPPTHQTSGGRIVASYENDSTEATCDSESEWTLAGEYTDEEGNTYHVYCKDQRNDAGECERVCIGVLI